MIQLGEKIELNGFKILEGSEIVVLKKLIGNYANKLGEFTRLSLSLKSVHKKEQNQKFQINVMLEKDRKRYEAEYTDYNLFFVVNEVLERIKRDVEKDKTEFSNKKVFKG